LQAFNFRHTSAKGTIDRVHEGTALQIENGNLDTIPGLHDSCTTPIIVLGIIVRAENSMILFERIKYVFIVPDVIAAGDNVDTERKQLTGDLLSQSLSIGTILTIDNTKVDPMLVSQHRQHFGRNLNPWLANDICDK
jgi:hypothetical protein